MRKILKKVPAFLLALILIVSVLPVTTMAASNEATANIDFTVTLTSLDPSHFPRPAEEYQVKLTAVNGAPIKIGGEDLGASMTQGVQSTDPSKSVVTGFIGPLSFSRVGIYEYTLELVPGDHIRAEYDSSKYDVKVTVSNAEAGGLETHVAIRRNGGDAAKCDANFVVDYIPNITVEKRWLSKPSFAPETVSVYLVVDGKAVEDSYVKLGEHNDWTHVWTDMVGRGQKWKVVEDRVAGGFSVSYNYDYDRGHAVVTNAYVSGLIQTGQLNWPIPVLGVLGAAVMAYGFYLIFKKRENEQA